MRAPAPSRGPRPPRARRPPPAKPKPSPSVLSSDITITGNIRSSGDIQIEGTIEGDMRAHTLIVGETATVKGEVVAEEVVVNGRVVGRLRGLKVRLSTSARVEGDIVHKTIAIESGAHFEGSVQRQEDPLGQGQQPRPAATAQQNVPRRTRSSPPNRPERRPPPGAALRLAPEDCRAQPALGRDHPAIEMPGGVAEHRQTTTSPRKNGTIAATSPPAMIAAQISIGRRFGVTALKLVTMAVTKSISRSSSIGSDTAVNAKSTKAIAPPTSVPTTSIDQAAAR